MKNKVADVKAELLAKRSVKKWTPDSLLSTGSTLLNCALSDYETGGILTGEIIVTVGASSSGKTAWYHGMLAEACENPRFDDYDLYVDDSEGGALFNVRKFWGKKLAKRLKPPSIDKDGKPVYSSTIENMVDTLDDLCNKGKPFIFIEDSMDALMTNDEQRKFMEQKRARRLNKKEGGSYGTDRAKKISQSLRMLRSKIRKNNSIVILIFQERQNLGYGQTAESKTHAGGLAPKFFANVQLWFNVKKQLVKKTGNIKTEMGIISQIKIKKNRLTGKLRTVCIPFFHSYGFDDTGSCVDYLVESGHWKKKGNSINAGDMGFSLPRGALIAAIEAANRESELRKLVGETWRKIEEANSLHRKKRYG